MTVAKLKHTFRQTCKLPPKVPAARRQRSGCSIDPIALARFGSTFSSPQTWITRNAPGRQRRTSSTAVSPPSGWPPITRTPFGRRVKLARPLSNFRIGYHQSRSTAAPQQGVRRRVHDVRRPAHKRPHTKNPAHAFCRIKAGPDVTVVDF